MLRLGQHVRDKASGYTGHINSHHITLTGIVQWGIQPRVTADKPGELPPAYSVDGFLLEVLDEGYADEVPKPDSTVTILLGEEVEDQVSKVRGIADEVVTFQNGCVTAPQKADKKIRVFCSHRQLKRVGKGLAPQVAKEVAKPAASRTGGPSRPSPRCI